MNRQRSTRIFGPVAFIAGVAICIAIGGCAESPESPDVLIERGHLMEGRGNFQEAIDAYTKALSSRPDQATIYYDRGVAYGRLRRWKDAIEDYSQAIRHDPSLARAYNNRAAAYAQQRQFAEAVADLTKAVSLDTKSALAYRNRGLAYHDLGQLNQAIEDYNVAIRLEPTAFESYFERGNAFLDLGQNQKAIADYDQALALDTGRATVWLNRGQAYRRLGKLAQAQADFVKARQLDPSIKPDELAQAPFQAVAPAQPVATPVSPQTDFAQLEVARRERALQVATDFLKGKGLHVRPAPAGAPFALLCESAKGKYRVDVKLSADEKTPLRLTREEIDALGHSDVPTALVIVSKLTLPATAGQPCTGGAVMRFIENWKPAPEKLIPVVFEYPLG